jgi:small-conductance mechanosensitive channel
MVRLGTTVGTVRKINLRATVIQTIYNEHLIVPNSQFINETVENMSYEDLKLKISVKVGVAYSSDPRVVREALIEAALRTEYVMKTMDPYVLFRDFGESSLDFELFAWIDGPLRRYQIESELRFNVFQIFRERDITIPFPQRDLWVKQLPREPQQDGPQPSNR